MAKVELLFGELLVPVDATHDAIHRPGDVFDLDDEKAQILAEREVVQIIKIPPRKK